MAEIDITVKVKKIIKYALPAVLCVALLGTTAVWLFQKNNKQLTLYDAKVNGKMVQTRCRAEGTVTEVLIEDGSAVKAGQKLANIKVKVTEEQLQQLQQNVVLAEDNLARLKEGVTITRPVYHSGGGSSAATERLARMEELYRLGAISAAELESASVMAGSSGGSEVTYETVVQASSPEAIQNGERRLQQARAALERVKQNSQATEITAPVSGNVYLQELQVGKEIKTGEILALIGSADNLWLEAVASEAQSQQVYVGQVAKCKINGKTFDGTVTEVISLQQAKEKQMQTLSEEEKKLSVVYVALPELSDVAVRPGDAAELELSLT